MPSKEKLPLELLAITFNLRKSHKSDEHEEYDDIETIYALKKELQRFSRTIVLLEQDKNIFKTLKELQPDYVFNICEGLGSFRSRESQLPNILEMLDIKYFGSDATSLNLTLDKYLSHIILKNSDIPVPRMYLVNSQKEIKYLERLRFGKDNRYIVKPRWEGSSKGIFNKSLVSSLKQCQKLTESVIDSYKQPVVVEEFLEGSEITVGLAGNKNVQVLGMMKIAHKNKEHKNFVYGLEVKRNWRKEVLYIPEVNIESKLRKQITETAIKAFKAFELRDAARIDFRLDEEGIARIIDINPLPGLSPVYSDLPILFKLKKKTYKQLMDIIIKTSLKRCGFIK
jgi:D-alanine-D-alanine ligase